LRHLKAMTELAEPQDEACVHACSLRLRHALNTLAERQETPLPTPVAEAIAAEFDEIVPPETDLVAANRAWRESHLASDAEGKLAMRIELFALQAARVLGDDEVATAAALEEQFVARVVDKVKYWQEAGAVDEMLWLWGTPWCGGALKRVRSAARQKFSERWPQVTRFRE
jgi:hypothetical protein